MPAKQQRGPGSILVVDDVADNRDILVRRFRRQGYDATEAVDGYEALRLLDEQAFDVVLLDVMMPGLDGMEVLKRIRSRWPAALLPVVMVTAKGQSDDVVKAISLGANDYVTKPIDFPVTLARVSAQIERRFDELDLRESRNDVQSLNEHLKQDLKEREGQLTAVGTHLEDEIARRLLSDQKSEFLAFHDAVTGLPNRHSCDERLPELLQQVRGGPRELALLFIDLDGFKNVNDTLGHSVGDALLKTIGVQVREVCQSTDFVARLGGDEFAIVHLSENVQSTARNLARTVIAAVSKCCLVEGQQVFVGASIGIAIADETITAGALLKRADLAMYRAKSDGRGVYCMFEPQMEEQVQRRRTLELSMRTALQRGEFSVQFQPIVTVKTGRLSGFEALLRWQQGTRGMVPPAEFISLAEETGLIIPIGEWALRQACEQAAGWPDGLRVAVNVSPIQFRTPRLFPLVVNTLAATGLAPERLELEITESVLLQNTQQAVSILKSLREIGVRISMDDFGTGYSSLGYLHSFPFDKVKIDRSFVSGSTGEQDGRAIVRAVVGLGESFGMTTTAEGVETIEQFEYLRQEGCEEVQGFLFGKAAPAWDVMDMIERFNGPQPMAGKAEKCA